MNELSKHSVSIEVYKTIFETWRSQVDSYWQRSNYFAAFETAALAGCWYFVEHHHPKIVLFLSVLGLALTVIWGLSNAAVHRYVEYWWESIKKIEEKLSFQDEEFGFVSKHPGSRGSVRYSNLVQLVPLLFMACWIVLLLIGWCSLCSHGR